MKRILIILMLLLLCAATAACSSKQEPTEPPTATEAAAPTDPPTEAAEQPAETSAPTQATEAPAQPPTEAANPFDGAAAEEWVRNGYWCKLSDDGASVMIYTFSDEDAGHDMFYGYGTLYDITAGKLVKNNAMDNPTIINYRFEDGAVSAIGEGGLQTTFYLSDDGSKMNQTGESFTNTYYRFSELPETFAQLQEVYSTVM